MKVLSPNTPFQQQYRSVRIGVFNAQEALYGDDRLAANALVVGVEVDGQFKGYPIEELRRAGGVVNNTLAGRPIVVLYDDASQTGIAYSRVVNGQSLEFSNAAPQALELQDRATGSRWDHQGRAVAGPLTSAALEFVPSFLSEWYGWSAYHPETLLFRADE